MLIYSNAKIIRKATTKDIEASNEEFIPFIKAEKTNGKCKLGYINTNRTIRECPIRIGNVVINNVHLETKIEDDDCAHKYTFSYSIEIEVSDNVTNGVNFIISQSEEKNIFYNCINNDYENIHVFETLFEKLIPLINSYIECKLPISDINSNSINLFFLYNSENKKDKPNYHLLKLVDKFYVDSENGKSLLRCYIDELKTFNDIWFICKCLNTNYEIEGDKIFIPITEEQTRTYKSILYYNFIQNEFNEREELALVKFSELGNYLCPNYIFYQPSEKESRICSFIIRLKGTSEHVGDHRVGRDDCEFDFKSISISVKNTENPSEEFVSMISRIVNHELKFNKCSFRDCKGDYRWYEHTNVEYVAGLACKTYDTGSDEMTYGNRIKLVKEIIQTKNFNFDEFEKWEI